MLGRSGLQLGRGLFAERRRRRHRSEHSSRSTYRWYLYRIKYWELVGWFVFLTPWLSPVKVGFELKAISGIGARLVPRQAGVAVPSIPFPGLMLPARPAHKTIIDFRTDAVDSTTQAALGCVTAGLGMRTSEGIDIVGATSVMTLTDESASVVALKLVIINTLNTAVFPRVKALHAERIRACI